MPSFTVQADTTQTHGRAVIASRHHRYVTDEPSFMGGPGEAPGPHEYFLMGVAGCATNLIESFARHEGIPVQRVEAELEGTVDPSRAPRQDVNMFCHMRLRLSLAGVSATQAQQLVHTYKQRCPLYGTIVASIPLEVEWALLKEDEGAST